MRSLFVPKIQRAKIEKARRIEQQLFQLDPPYWLTKQFKEGPENLKWSRHKGYNKHRWDGTEDPLWKAIDALSRFKNVGIEAATGVGKTWFLARVCYWFLDAFPGSLVITTAPTKQQLEEVLWKELGRAYPRFKRIRPYSDKYSLKVKVDRREPESFELEDKNVTHKMLGFVSSKKAGAESDVKFQGHHQKYQLFVLEECAGLDHSILKAIESTNIRRGNMAIAVGNPDSQLDALHEFCEKRNTVHIVISSYDHPNVVLGRDVIPGAVTQKSIDERRVEYGELSPFFKSRVRGIAPKQDRDSMILHEWVVQCLKSSEEYADPAVDNSWPAVGVDVAHSENGDKAALVWGRENVCEDIHEFQCPSTTHLAYNMFLPDHEIREKYGEEAVYNTHKIDDFGIEDRMIGVDGVGVGAGTVDTFKDNGFNVISLAGGQIEELLKLDSDGKPFYEFNNLRSQMFWELAKDFEHANIIVNISNRRVLKDMMRELLQIKYFVRGGKICVESKEEIKKRIGGKSPNIADAMAYWNWVRKNPYTGPKFLPFR